MVVTTESFEQLALAQPERHWELHDGELREKPPMSYVRGDIMFELVRLLQLQLDPLAYRVRANTGHVRRSARNYYIPDVLVVPFTSSRPAVRLARAGEIYTDPLPLVIEIWSPSTGRYDVDAKIPQYRQRGDLEIWRIHPFDHTLTVWRRQPDGSYMKTLYREGMVQVETLPGVTIDLDALLAWADEVGRES